MATTQTRKPIVCRSKSGSVDYSRTQRPLSKRGYQPAHGTNFRPHYPPVLKQTYSWSQLPELSIRLRYLDPATTTYNIFQNFQPHGNIKLIELYEDQGGRRDGTGKIIFSPVPSEPFWKVPTGLGEYCYTIRLDADGNAYDCRIEPETSRKPEDFLIRSPIRPHISYPWTMKMIPTALHFGLMVDPYSMMQMQTMKSIPGHEFSFVVDLRRNRIVVYFTVEFVDPRSLGNTSFRSNASISEHDRKNRYMIEIPFSQLNTIRQTDLSNNMASLIISLESPPAFYRRREALESSHSEEILVWTEFDAWFRQTDIIYDPYMLTTSIVTTNKDNPVIDIGNYP